MMLWIILALMSAAAILAVLWPLAREPRANRAGSDLVVYQDQLEEIGRDRSAGLIGEAEAEAARIEVSRRLLAAAHTPAPPPAARPLWHRRTAALAALIVLSLVPVGLYAALGSPNVPGQPAYARAAMPPDHESIAALIGQVEEHLAKNPNDGAGWQVIAPVYMRLGRYDDAVTALRKSLALNGETATRDSDLGEALAAAANGVVTDEAKQLFARAVARDAHDPKAGYFLGLADEQDGNREAAAAKWRAMLEDAPANAPWVGFVRQALARVTGVPSRARVRPHSRWRRRKTCPRRSVPKWSAVWYKNSPIDCTRTEATSKAGSVWCAPTPCWATRKRPREPLPMPSMHSPTIPTIASGSTTSSKVSVSKGDGRQICRR